MMDIVKKQLGQDIESSLKATSRYTYLRRLLMILLLTLLLIMSLIALMILRLRLRLF